MAKYRATISYELSYELDTEDIEDYFDEDDEAWLQHASDMLIAEHMATLDAQDMLVEDPRSGVAVRVVNTNVKRVEACDTPDWADDGDD